MSSAGMTPRERDSARWRTTIAAQASEDAFAAINAVDIWQPKDGFVYFLFSDVGPIKIGFAVDVEKRVSSLRNMNPGKLIVAATSPGTISLETEYHRRFADHRLHGEWFVRHPDILAEIDRINAGSGSK